MKTAHSLISPIRLGRSCYQFYLDSPIYNISPYRTQLLLGSASTLLGAETCTWAQVGKNTGNRSKRRAEDILSKSLRWYIRRVRHSEICGSEIGRMQKLKGG